jgi:hypothetical protein
VAHPGGPARRARERWFLARFRLGMSAPPERVAYATIELRPLRWTVTRLSVHGVQVGRRKNWRLA